MCIIRQVKQLDLVRQLSLILHFRLLNEWCGLLKISTIGSDGRMRTKSLNKRFKGLFTVADRRTVGASGVGLSSIMLLLISGNLFRLFGAKVWQMDKYLSDKLQCSEQDPKRAVALISN